MILKPFWWAMLFCFQWAISYEFTQFYRSQLSYLLDEPNSIFFALEKWDPRLAFETISQGVKVDKTLDFCYDYDQT